MTKQHGGDFMFIHLSLIYLNLEVTIEQARSLTAWSTWSWPEWETYGRDTLWSVGPYVGAVSRHVVASK